MCHSLKVGKTIIGIITMILLVRLVCLFVCLFTCLFTYFLDILYEICGTLNKVLKINHTTP